MTVDRIFWQAHRGGGANDMPDNTMASFLYGWQLGAIPEADLRTTTDGVFVCFHDNTVERTTTAPPEAAGKAIGDFSFEEIRSWDAGVRFSPKYAGQQIPSLREVFSKMKELPNAKVYIDLKEVSLEALAGLIANCQIANQVIIASSSREECDTLKQISSDLQTMLWIGGTADEIESKFLTLAQDGFDQLNQVQLHLNPAENDWPFQLEPGFIKTALQKTQNKKRDLELFPWVHDDPAVRTLLDLGVRWFATDDAKAFLQTITSWQTERETS